MKLELRALPLGSISRDSNDLHVPNYIAVFHNRRKYANRLHALYAYAQLHHCMPHIDQWRTFKADCCSAMGMRHNKRHTQQQAQADDGHPSESTLKLWASLGRAPGPTADKTMPWPVVLPTFKTSHCHRSRSGHGVANGSLDLGTMAKQKCFCVCTTGPRTQSLPLHLFPSSKRQPLWLSRAKTCEIASRARNKVDGSPFCLWRCVNAWYPDSLSNRPQIGV